ncbi:hypothetical protein FRC0104_02343 [Corynebacterium diphtheriae]|nr:hypothetical protein FRC0084_00692 [Corynebacterium diphtheriae]CAB0765281.1 hypothetical protein FRC0104_02343 [Corynebacterium diphtheriae]CAB0853845.1 hypothetical protein FRC0356_00687 [Corynebacterium diphtheriae]CAB0986953.1 hypothetical protein FRC0513_00715 [Corynebacterium diphtheriae]
MPGPVPKRSDQRRRRNKDTTGLHIVKDLPATAKATPPRVSPNWHPLMKDWFRSLKESGQSAFYEPSDWQTARLLAEVMSQELNSGEAVKASMLAEFNRAAAALLTTEGERRRLRVELQAGESSAGDDVVVSTMENYRNMFS